MKDIENENSNKQKEKKLAPRNFPRIFVKDGIEYTFEEIDEMMNCRDWRRTF